MVQSMKNAQIANVHSKLMLDLTDDGRSVTQKDWDRDKKSQRWNITVVDEGDNRCLIENVQCNAVLAPGDDWGVVFEPKGEIDQQWRLTSSRENVYFIENPYGGQGLVLEVEGSSKAVGALVAQYKKNHPATANQQWQLIGSPEPPTPLGRLGAC